MIYDSSKTEWNISLKKNELLVYAEDSEGAFAKTFNAKEAAAFKSSSFHETLVKKSVSQLKLVGLSELVAVVSRQLSGLENCQIKEVLINEDSELLLLPAQKRLRKKKKSLKVAPAEDLDKVYKVLVVDDSSTIRTLLKNVLKTNKQLEVVDVVSNPLDLPEALKKHNPDVVTLDIHMPEMDGVEALKKFVAPKGIPAVMISSVKMEEGPLVLEALSSGAIDYIEKPALEKLDVVTPEITARVLNAAKSGKTNKAPKLKSAALRPQRALTKEEALQTLTFIGSSTGGTQALQDILTQLPAVIPPICIVQHIPAVFSKALAERLNSLCKFEVKEAEDGDKVEASKVLIAPGGKQMKFEGTGPSNWCVRITDDAPVNRFKPSVDYFFTSLQKAPRNINIVGAILTGMGRDGAAGLLHLKDLGATTMAQDEESSIVYGMPKAATENGAAEQISSLQDFPNKLMENFLGTATGTNKKGPLKKAS